jgi:hypothetical protein
MNLYHLASAAWQMAIIAAAIAVLSAAVVQLLKDLLPVRRWFQRHYLKAWFRQRVSARQGGVADSNFGSAEQDLVHLATGGDRKAFYDLETAQLCGQMNSAAQIAVAYANRHKALLNCLAPEADPKDIETVASPPVSSPSAGEAAMVAQSTEVTAFLDARNRLSHHLQRSVDAIQISMGFRWKLILQIVCYSVCLLASFAAVFVGEPNGRYNVIEALTIAIVAGFVAPSVSDLLGAINRVSKR